jgi:hypothetical protein
MECRTSSRVANRDGRGRCTMRVPSERQRVAHRPRKPRKKMPLAPAITPVGLARVLVYLPVELVRRIKLAAVDRDEEISRGTRESNDESGVVAIRGMSGVVAQVMTGHFALSDMLRDMVEESRTQR